MSQEHTGEHTPLAEVLKKHGRLLEQIASDQSRPLELGDLLHVDGGVTLPWADLTVGEVVDIVGWPSRHTWAGEPSVKFNTGESGDISFFTKTLEEQNGENQHLYGLNNFWAMLHTKPYAFDGEMPKSVSQLTYSPLPALIRAWTIFPDFMSALREELNEIGVLYKMGEVFTERIEAEELELLRASRLAYGLMTRLVCRSDRDLQARLQDSMFPDKDELTPRRNQKPIIDPSVELWT